MYLSTIILLLCCFLENASGLRRFEGERGSQAKFHRRLQKRRNSAKEDFQRTKIFHQKLYKLPNSPASVITKNPTNTVQCKIFCRSGYHLQILPGGQVKGTVNQASKFVYFEMQSFGPSVVKLKSNATGRYLTMRRDGSLRGVRHSYAKDALFKETHEQNAFHSYASNRYFKEEPYDMLVGIKRNGQVKKATRTVPGQTSTQFLVIKFP